MKQIALFLPLMIAIVLIATSCANSVSGEVGDYLISGVQDSIYWHGHDADGNIVDSSYRILITSVPNACSAYPAIDEVTGESCEDICSNWQDVKKEFNLPNKVWEIELSLLSGEVVADYTPSHFNAGQGNGSVAYYDGSGRTKKADCLVDCEAFQTGREELESRGQNWMTMEITGYEDSEFIKGMFDMDLDGGYNAWGRFNATHCDAFEQ